MELILLREIAIIFGLSLLVLLVLNRLRIPPILGFFITGIIAGPQVLGLVQSGEQVNTLAEIGVILLLFTIGLEFSTDKFGKFKKTALLGGSLQIFMITAVVFILCYLLGFSSNEALFLGLIVSLSSTAVVLKILQDNQALETPQGQASLGILIFQDLAVVPIILLLPFLSGISTGTANFFNLLFQGVLILIGTIVAARWVAPALMDWVARSKSRELFLLLVIVICATVTWITSNAGLSPALGAFLAGLIIANTEYAHRAQGNILPFQEVFLSFFFVSVGMLLDINFFFSKFFVVIGAVILLISFKSILNGLVGYILGYSLRIVVLIGFILAQIGEFSFILSETGLRYGLISADTFQTILALSVISMALTPFMISASPRLADRFSRLPVPPKVKKGRYFKGPSDDLHLENHLVIVGFGITGKKLAQQAEEKGIPYIALDINPEVVKKARDKFYHVYYGDATHLAVLKQFQIKKAAMLVVAIADYPSTVRVVEEARFHNPLLRILVRVSGYENLEPLYTSGVDLVVSEKREASQKIIEEAFHCFEEYCVLNLDES